MMTSPVEAMRRAFRVEERPNFGPRYNIAPTNTVPIVRRRREGGRELLLARWGLLPFWAKDERAGARLINARAETVASSPAFRDSFAKRRCLVPADGFYEWRTIGRRKQPFLIRPVGEGPFAMAGLWSLWRAPDGREVPSFTIITTQANETLAPLHDRMPVILSPADYEAWLDPATPDAQDLLVPYDPAAIELFPVSPRVNDVRNDDPELIEPLGAEDGSQDAPRAAPRNGVA